MTTFGYARVSTVGQDLKTQIEHLIQAGVKKENIISEKYSGTTTQRPAFQKLLNLVRPNDTIVITKLDRLARNTREALNIIEKLLESNISINVLNIGKIENSSVGKLIYTILLAIAEMEREMIVERTQEGKAFAKKNNPNYREGRPRRTLSKRYLKAIEIMQTHSISETEIITGISTATLKRIRKQYKEEVADGKREKIYNI